MLFENNVQLPWKLHLLGADLPTLPCAYTWALIRRLYNLPWIFSVSNIFTLADKNYFHDVKYFLFQHLWPTPMEWGWWCDKLKIWQPLIFTLDTVVCYFNWNSYIGWNFFSIMNYIMYCKYNYVFSFFEVLIKLYWIS